MTNEPKKAKEDKPKPWAVGDTALFLWGEERKEGTILHFFPATATKRAFVALATTNDAGDHILTQQNVSDIYPDIETMRVETKRKALARRAARLVDDMYRTERSLAKEMAEGRADVVRWERELGTLRASFDPETERLFQKFLRRENA